MLKHFNETEIDDELENVSIDNKSYTVNELKEIFADNPCENDATYIISMVLYDTLIGRNELDKSGYPLRSEILAEYSYQVCKKLGLSDEEIFA